MMCETSAVRRDKWLERVKGRVHLFKTIRNELYQMETKIDKIDDLNKAEKAKERLLHFWKIFEGTCLEPIEES